VTAINHTQKNGFAGGQLVLPNGTEVYFLTWNQKPSDFQGWQIGARISEYKWKHYDTGELLGQGELIERILKGLKDSKGSEGIGEAEVLALARKGRWRRIENIGAWGDENMTMEWLTNIPFRLATNGAKMGWTYTPIDGVTLAVKEVRGAAKVVKTRPSVFLKGSHFRGLPVGHMPYVEEPRQTGLGRKAIIYFFCEWNPFGGYEYVRGLCEGKSVEFTRCRACGYAEELRSRAWPKFGSHNIVKESELPRDGTNYMLTDPAGNRNWATIWVRVAAGNPSRLFIYREWPDVARHGEWAVADGGQNPNPDGGAGPAQRNLGKGIVDYKRLWLESERIKPGPEEDPYRAAGQGLSDGSGRGSEEYDYETAAGGVVTRERIFRRFIDPRAGKNQKQSEMSGSTCIIDEMAKVQRDGNGIVVGPQMIFTPASGIHIEDGVTEVTELLRWDDEKEFCPVLNEPRLYVSEKCGNVIWTLNNYTASGGESGGCKDFADLLRYMALADLRYVTRGMMKVRQGGSY
jgi:hypothetical protein